jgi:CRP-like cAMP-binding protein
VRALLQSLAAQNAQLSLLAGSLSLQSARSRLAAFLIKQADQPVLQGGITQEEIAAEIGTVREIVARQLRDFAQAGWLERRRQRLVLKNRAALEEEARRW